VVALFVYSAVYKSISLGLLAELDRQDERGLSVQEITERHVYTSFRNRINILVAAGYVSVAGTRYRLTDAGQRLATRIRAVQHLFGIKHSGLYGLVQSSAPAPPAVVPQLPVDSPRRTA
jgi:hypothetical protein